MGLKNPVKTARAMRNKRRLSRCWLALMVAAWVVFMLWAVGLKIFLMGLAGGVFAILTGWAIITLNSEKDE